MMNTRWFPTQATFRFLIVAIIAMGLVAGCVSSAPSAAPQAAQEPAAPAEGEQITVTWLNHWGGPDTSAYWEDVAAQYESENPGVNIEIVTTGFNDLLTTFMTQYGTGNSPDVFHIKYDLLPDLVAAGAVVPPSDEAIAEIREGWSQAGVDGMTWEGQIWGYPTEIGLRGLMYNEKLLQEASVEMPAYPDGYSFDEYAAVVQQIAENTDAKGAGFIIQYEASLVENFTNFLWNNGGEFTNEDNTQVLFNSPEGVEVLTLWKNMIDAGAVSLFNTDDMASALATESVATYADANWWKLMFFETYDETHSEGAAQETFKVTGIPWATDKYSRAYVFGLVVSSQSQNPEEAWKWARYIAYPRSAEQNSYMADFLSTFYGIIPSNMRDQELSPAVQEPYTAAYVDLLNEYGRIQPMFEGYLEVQHILAGEIEKVFQTGKDPQAALDDAAAAADEVLARNATE